MSDFFNVNSYDTQSSMYNTLFGSLSTGNSSGSAASSLGDLQMIKSGAYKKALKAMYAKQKATDAEADDSISGSGKTDSEQKLSLTKSSATSMYKSTKALKNLNFDSASEDDIVKAVKGFADSYNSTINSTKDLNSYGILQTAVWATEQVGHSEALLNRAGITIGEDNTLKVDEEALKSADKSVLKTLFAGSGSLADRLNQKASALANQATNQLATNTGKAIYSSSATMLD